MTMWERWQISSDANKKLLFSIVGFVLIGIWLSTGCLSSSPPLSKDYVIGTVVEVISAASTDNVSCIFVKFDDAPNGIRVVALRHGTIVDGELVTFHLNKVNKIYFNTFGIITRIEVL